jgi:hypothetical protein
VVVLGKQILQAKLRNYRTIGALFSCASEGKVIFRRVISIIRVQSSCAMTIAISRARQNTA